MLSHTPCTLMRKQSLLFLTIFCIATICVFFFISSPDCKVSVTTAAPFKRRSNLNDESYSHVNYSSEIFMSSFNKSDCPCGELVYGEYCVVSPFSEKKLDDVSSSLTLCTQGTAEFLRHVLIQCSRWGGPMSVAVFTSILEYAHTLQVIADLRYCDFCIRNWVSWHVFYRTGENKLFHSACDTIEQSTVKSCKDLVQKKDDREMKINGPYPINVARNIARQAVSTPYVFVIDMELYPSSGILPMFDRMIKSSIPNENREVWAVPVFEVESDCQAPIWKSELMKMFEKKEAISFHKYKCNECHHIPNLTEWFKQEVVMTAETEGTLEKLKVFTTVKRNQHFKMEIWEPFFIGTNKDPEFDPRLSWEGRQNKMQLAYEMCMMDYDFHIVLNAFLVHSPGIKICDSRQKYLNIQYKRANRKWMSVIKQRIIQQYGNNEECYLDTEDYY